MSVASIRLEVASRTSPHHHVHNISSNVAASSLLFGMSNRQQQSMSTTNNVCRCYLSTAATATAATTTHHRSFSSPSIKQHQHYDIIIAGGGAVGSVLARLLLDDNFGSTGYIKNTGTTRRRRPLRLALVEARISPPTLKDLIAKNNSQTTQSSSSSSSPPDPRAYALSPTSLSYLGSNILQSLGQHNRVGKYDNMQIWEHDGPAQLHFVGEDLCKAIQDGRLVDLNALVGRSLDESCNGNGNSKTAKQRPWLGAVIEDAPLVSSLWDELRRDTRIDLVDNVQLTSIDTPSPQEVGNVIPPPPVQLSFTRRRSNKKNGKEGSDNVIQEDEETTCTITSNLLVAADGANSFVRRTVGNFPMTTHSYGRKAVTCTVQLEYGMKQTAYQRFLPHGPIALLPVRNGNVDEHGGEGGECSPKYANVVWSTTPTEANYLMSLSPSEFLSTLNHHLRQGPNINPSILPNNNNMIPFNIPLISTLAHEVDSLLRTANSAITMGTWTESPSRNYFRLPPKSIKVVSPIMGFDLGMSHVSEYTSPRVALVGDAAHTMHPMAGQGLNLGFDDVSSLAKLIKEAIDAGMDVGGTSLFLDRYNQERLMKGWGIVGGVHGLHELFECSSSSGSDLHGIMKDVSSGDGTSVRGLRNLIGYSRSLGMNVVNGLPMLRQTLAEVAAGATPPFVK